MNLHLLTYTYTYIYIYILTKPTPSAELRSGVYRERGRSREGFQETDAAARVLCGAAKRLYFQQGRHLLYRMLAYETFSQLLRSSP